MLRLGLAQMNPVMGDLEGNARRIKEILKELEERRVDIAVFPELALTGYPPKDLLLRLDFLRRTEEVLMDVVGFTADMEITVILGLPRMDDEVYDSAAVIRKGKLLGFYDKRFPLKYDERRYFSSGRGGVVLKTPEGKIGVTICEDMWNSPGPMEEYAAAGVDMVINISASPFSVGKIELRRDIASMKAYEHHYWVVCLNMYGGQDELVFDGSSFISDPVGRIYHQMNFFEEETAVVDVDLASAKSAFILDPRERFLRERSIEKEIEIPIRRKDDVLRPVLNDIPREEEQILRALMTALRDYVHKNGFSKVVVGLSGGIDSSLVAAVSALALGKENVLGILMPSMYTSKESIEDAQKLAENLGITAYTIPINEVFKAYTSALSEVFKETQPDVTEENLQARIRGNYLMSISNKFGHLVVTTGNKSEYATGYATLYGDMAGGYALIKDLYKTDVYRVARWVNEREGREIIPERVFVKPPSAELRPGQTDQDRLPPYEILDGILRRFIDEGMSPKEIVDAGYDEKTVEYVLRLVKGSEYKRYQSAPGPKITSRLFGLDWRQPITNHFLM